MQLQGPGRRRLSSVRCIELFGKAYFARGLIVSLNDKLHAIWTNLEAIKKLKDIQLARIIRQALDLDNTISLTDNWLQRSSLQQPCY